MEVTRSAEFEALNPSAVEVQAVGLRWVEVLKREGDVPAADAVALLLEMRERQGAAESLAAASAVSALSEGRRTPRRHQRFAIGIVFWVVVSIALLAWAQGLWSSIDWDSEVADWAGAWSLFSWLWGWLFVIFALPTVGYRLFRHRQVRPIRPWLMYLGALACVTAGPALLLLAVERTDWVDYQDEGHAGEVAIAGLMVLVLGFILLPLSFRSEERPSQTEETPS